MDDHEREVYGSEIPDEVDMDADVDMSRYEEGAAKVVVSGTTPSLEIPSNPKRTPINSVSVARNGRDEEAAEGDRGGGGRSPRDACQSREGDGCSPRSGLVLLFAIFP